MQSSRRNKSTHSYFKGVQASRFANASTGEGAEAMLLHVSNAPVHCGSCCRRTAVSHLRKVQNVRRAFKERSFFCSALQEGEVRWLTEI